MSAEVGFPLSMICLEASSKLSLVIAPIMDNAVSLIVTL